jgi:hypothetical protein
LASLYFCDKLEQVQACQYVVDPIREIVTNLPNKQASRLQKNKLYSILFYFIKPFPIDVHKVGHLF